MGSWIATLAGHKKDALESLKNPHNIAAYALFFGFIACILLLWVVIAILTTIRIYKKRSRRSKDGETGSKVKSLVYIFWARNNETQILPKGAQL